LHQPKRTPYNAPKSAISILLVSSILLASQTLQAQEAYGHGSIDQSFTGPGTDLQQIVSHQPLGQEFTPTVDNLIAVDLFIDLHGAAADITVTIREGSISGTILGSTTQTVSTPGLLKHFDFPTSVPLTPGSIHVIQVQVEATSFDILLPNIQFSIANPYAGGQAIFFGGPVPAFDFLFTTYFKEKPVKGTFTITETGKAIVKKPPRFSEQISTVRLEVSGNYWFLSDELKITKLHGTLIVMNKYETRIDLQSNLINIRMTVSEDLKTVSINAKYVKISDSGVSAVLKFKSPIDFEDGTDSRTRDGNTLIAKLGKITYDTKDTATGRITFG